MRLISRTFLIAMLVTLLSGCGYNAIQQKDEAVKAGWSEVLNQYKRRADLIPNLVKTVQGYAQQERQVLTDVTNARARVGQINVNADDAADPSKSRARRSACPHVHSVDGDPSRSSAGLFAPAVPAPARRVAVDDAAPHSPP